MSPSHLASSDVPLDHLPPGEPRQQPRRLPVEGEAGHGAVPAAQLQAAQEPLDHLGRVEDEHEAALGAHGDEVGGGHAGGRAGADPLDGGAELRGHGLEDDVAHDGAVLPGQGGPGRTAAGPGGQGAAALAAPRLHGQGVSCGGEGGGRE